MKNNNYQLYTTRWQNINYEVYLNFKLQIKDMEYKFIDIIYGYITKHYKLPSKVNVLDVGCGDSRLQYMLLKKLDLSVLKYIGVDCNEIVIKNNFMNNRYSSENVNLYIEDINNYFFEDKFDIILGFNSFYGIKFEKIIDLIKSLKKSGLLIILHNSKNGLFHKLSILNSFKISTAEDIERYMHISGLPFNSYLLSYKFKEEFDLSKIRWLEYLVGEKNITAQHLALFNKIEEVEELIIHQRN